MIPSFLSHRNLYNKKYIDWQGRLEGQRYFLGKRWEVGGGWWRKGHIDGGQLPCQQFCFHSCWGYKVYKLTDIWSILTSSPQVRGPRNIEPISCWLCGLRLNWEKYEIHMKCQSGNQPVVMLELLRLIQW